MVDQPIPPDRVRLAFKKHTPGGVDHPQEGHGNWSDGSSDEPTGMGLPKPQVFPTGNTEAVTRQTQRLNDLKASGFPMMRGMFVQVPDDMRTQIHELMQTPMLDEQIDQHLKIGPMLNEFFDGNYGVHWTTSPRMATTASSVDQTGSGNLEVLLFADPPDVSQLAAIPDQTGVHSGDQEISVTSGADLNVNSIWIRDGQSWREVLDPNKDVYPTMPNQGHAFTKHRPGGVDHDQQKHGRKGGSWTDGAAAFKPTEKGSAFGQAVRDFRKEFAALPDDALVVVYHATTQAKAKEITEGGLKITDKPMTLPRRRYEAGEYAEFAPGAGISGGTYVSGNLYNVEGYGNSILAMKVPKGSLKVPPEGRDRPLDMILMDHDGAVVTTDVPASNIINLYPERRTHVPAFPPDKVFDAVKKHLPGGHDQKKHGNRTLYRGEGSHDRTSYYTASSDMAGGWWTEDIESARRYATGQEGEVYQVEVNESEAEKRGLAYFISDPEVRARRVPVAKHYPGGQDHNQQNHAGGRGLGIGSPPGGDILSEVNVLFSTRMADMTTRTIAKPPRKGTKFPTIKPGELRYGGAFGSAPETRAHVRDDFQRTLELKDADIARALSDPIGAYQQLGGHVDRISGELREMRELENASKKKDRELERDAQRTFRESGLEGMSAERDAIYDERNKFHEEHLALQNENRKRRDILTQERRSATEVMEEVREDVVPALVERGHEIRAEIAAVASSPNDIPKFQVQNAEGDLVDAAAPSYIHSRNLDEFHEYVAEHYPDQLDTLNEVEALKEKALVRRNNAADINTTYRKERVQALVNRMTDKGHPDAAERALDEGITPGPHENFKVSRSLFTPKSLAQYDDRVKAIRHIEQAGLVVPNGESHGWLDIPEGTTIEQGVDSEGGNLLSFKYPPKEGARYNWQTDDTKPPIAVNFQDPMMYATGFESMGELKLGRNKSLFREGVPSPTYINSDSEYSATLPRSGDDTITLTHGSYTDLLQDEAQRHIGGARRLESKANKNLETLARELRQTRSKEQVVIDVLSKHRPMGGSKIETTNKRTNKAIAQLHTATEAYPTDWIDRSNARGPLRVKQLAYKRAHYSDHGSEPYMRIDPNGVLSDDTLHEVGHRFEASDVRIRTAEQGFYDIRTKDDTRVSLRRYTGNRNYGSEETTRPDMFPIAYMGRDYSDHFFETFTTAYPITTGRSVLPKPIRDQVGKPRPSKSKAKLVVDRADLSSQERNWIIANESWPEQEAFILGMLAEL